MRFTNNLNLSAAITQTTGNLVALAETPEAGERCHSAILKAIEEVFYNKTIQFNEGVLTFISRDSKKQRTVNENGCHESCDCKNLMSYHRALFEIVSRYHALESAPLVEGAKSVEIVGGIETHYKVINGKRVKTVEKVAGMVIWRREKTQPFTPPIGADSNVVVPFKSKSAKSKSLSITELPEAVEAA